MKRTSRKPAKRVSRNGRSYVVKHFIVALNDDGSVSKDAWLPKWGQPSASRLAALVAGASGPRVIEASVVKQGDVDAEVARYLSRVSKNGYGLPAFPGTLRGYHDAHRWLVEHGFHPVPGSSRYEDSMRRTGRIVDAGDDYRVEIAAPIRRNPSSKRVSRNGYGRSYSGDPRWMTARYDGTDDQGNRVRKGDEVLYWPSTKKMMTGQRAKDAWLRFLSEKGDEEGMPFARNGWSRRASKAWSRLVARVSGATKGKRRSRSKRGSRK